MSARQTAEPKYGNWVSARLIYVLIATSIPFLMLAFVSIMFIVGAFPFLLLSAYFAYARFKFSQRGGNLQAIVRNLVVEYLRWDGQGKALDIGCGNAPLAIELAKRYPKAHVTAIDYWSGKWEYSKAVCERNAEIEGVAGRVMFQKASAAALPFESDCFDAAVSNLVFSRSRRRQGQEGAHQGSIESRQERGSIRLSRSVPSEENLWRCR